MTGPVDAVAVASRDVREQVPSLRRTVSWVIIFVETTRLLSVR